ncbi:MAG: hypothetical protein OEU74_07370 [Gammaproteobacteria bacterium]|nr:hypothetical protein [Gammaproteobacteria bacterium]
MTDFVVWLVGWNTDIPDIDEQHIAMAKKLNQIAEMLNQSAVEAETRPRIG